MTNNRPEISPKNIMYLLAIYRLEQTDRFVRCVDIGTVLSVSRPTVHAMINYLADIRMLEKNKYGKVTLTEEGRLSAKIYQNGYIAVEKFLKRIYPGSKDLGLTVCTFLSQIEFEYIPIVCSNT